MASEILSRSKNKRSKKRSKNVGVQASEQMPKQRSKKRSKKHSKNVAMQVSEQMLNQHAKKRSKEHSLKKHSKNVGIQASDEQMPVKKKQSRKENPLERPPKTVPKTIKPNEDSPLIPKGFFAEPDDDLPLFTESKKMIKKMTPPPAYETVVKDLKNTREMAIGDDDIFVVPKGMKISSVKKPE